MMVDPTSVDSHFEPQHPSGLRATLQPSSAYGAAELSLLLVSRGNDTGGSST
jgi:hypothetical protein